MRTGDADAEDFAATFAPRASTATKNPAVPRTALYNVFKVQGYVSLRLGGVLSFNLIFPPNEPDVWRLMNMWSIWMFTIPSLRARDCWKNEKEALNFSHFLIIPLINAIIPFFCGCLVCRHRSLLCHVCLEGLNRYRWRFCDSIVVSGIVASAKYGETFYHEPKLKRLAMNFFDSIPNWLVLNSPGTTEKWLSRTYTEMPNSDARLCTTAENASVFSRVWLKKWWWILVSGK
ncbi:hypothetical protein V6N11_024578 [Hibiscus sabdariffa]|uniref:Uncharacterized protein n=1 Tax=Hibiscus sabdariffa TaxID=183260 RepID=A0ABR2QMS4_9ROSI